MISNIFKKQNQNLFSEENRVVCEAFAKSESFKFNTQLIYDRSESVLSEFLQIAHANPLSLSLKNVFEELDVDGDGYITRSELRTAFQRMGHSLSDQDIKAIYKHVDANNDGKINFQGMCLSDYGFTLNATLSVLCSDIEIKTSSERVHSKLTY
ncbi:unnamed protein product [Cylicostephanus goldi]|uniref:EF-hand domain-containing protein n=1 Tax=Cylicostephanus goldi TaxID=71465 RepID=A0A3P6U9F8_CYLGO|nr:unnamed protein product [Cylicostephanus goldi]